MHQPQCNRVVVDVIYGAQSNEKVLLQSYFMLLYIIHRTKCQHSSFYRNYFLGRMWVKRKGKVTNESRSHVSHNSSYFTQRVTGTQKENTGLHKATNSLLFQPLLPLSSARETVALQ